MDAKLRRRFELWGQMPEYKRRVAQSCAIVADALGKTSSWYVALSGGKDSTCVLDLVRRLAPETPAVFSDDEWNLPETVAYVRSVPNCSRIAANVRHADFFVSWSDSRPDPDIAQWVEAPANNGLQVFARQQDYTGAFIGLREDESAVRSVHLRTMGPLFYCRKEQVWQCNPIAWWSVDDVWAYIVSHDLPYNTAYDRLSTIGVPLAQQRIGPLAVGRVLGYGQMAILKRGWPELYNRFAERFPEARAYV